jgi:AraC-like DNA-binding protein
MKDFIYITTWATAADWQATAGRHQHDFTEIMVITRGGIGAWIEGAQVEAYRGDALCYGPGIKHREWALGRPSEFILITARDLKTTPKNSHVGSGDGRILTLAQWLAEERDTHDSARHRRKATLLDALLNEFMRNDEPKPPSALKRVREYMRENIAQHLTIDALADKACMSKYHFVRWYRRNTGTTPIEDLRHMRVDAACDQIRKSDAPLKTIAEQTGFSDEHYFSKVFSQYVGIPPGKFRRAGFNSMATLE